MLGTLSHSHVGLLMMERWHMFNMFYHIVELEDRQDLVQACLRDMDFSVNGHLQIILSKALTTGAKDIRIFATKRLRKYAIGGSVDPYWIRTGALDARWAIRLLAMQLYDPEVEVCEIAIKILEEACNKILHLEYLIKCRPALDHLGEIGAPLLLRFLSTSVGYHYLDELDYITQEMDDWFLGRNDTYVALVEASLARAYDETLQRPRTASDDVPDSMFEPGIVPPHFYRELARTEEGCKLLLESGHFHEFAAAIQDFDLSEEDPETIVKVKGALWAVGNVGSLELAARFLEETDVVQWIVRIAEGAEVMTMRGTAFFVLGLISRSLLGYEMLMEQGWEAATDDLGASTGLCLPSNLSKLFSMPPPKPAPASLEPDSEYLQLTDPDPVAAKILNLIYTASNNVLGKRAMNELSKLKTAKVPALYSPDLFRKALLVLERYHVRLFVRRFVLDLFDKSVMRKIVLDEDSDLEDEGGREVTRSISRQALKF